MVMNMTMLMCLVDTAVVIAAAAVDYYTNMTRYCERDMLLLIQWEPISFSP